MTLIDASIFYGYVVGRTRYGHREGQFEIPDEDLELFQSNPLKYVKKNDLDTKLELVIDDFDIKDYGDESIEYIISLAVEEK